MAETLKPSAAPPTRNVALDNLRVVAMLLGLVTHGVLPYTATGIARYPIRDCDQHVGADASYFAVHDFRMQLFFLLAGFAGAALATRRGVGALVRNRLARVALPLALAVVVVCPVMHLLFGHHTEGRGVAWEPSARGGWASPSFHLWFLYYLVLCCAPVVLLLALAHRVPARLVRAADAGARRFLAWRWKLPALAALVVPVLWDMHSWWIDSPSGWVPDLTIYLYYLGFFVAGVVLYRHQDLLAGIGKRWPAQLAVANLLVLPAMLKLTMEGNWAEEQPPGDQPAWLVGWKAAAIFLGGLYTWLMIGGLLGLFQRHFATSSGSWRYLADASYWCYLAGFPIQTALQIWLAPHALPILAEFLFVNVLTFGLLLASYELLVRHSWVGLMLNGKRPARVAESVPVVLVARVPAPLPLPECTRAESAPSRSGRAANAPPNAARRQSTRSRPRPVAAQWSR